MNQIAFAPPILANIAPQRHFAMLSGAGDFWTTPWDTIRQVQIIPGVRMEDDILVLPPSWVSTKRQRRIGSRTLDFTRCRAGQLDEGSIRRLKRLAAILLITPITHANGDIRQPCTPATWVGNCKALINAALWVNQQRGAPDSWSSSCLDGPPLFSGLNPEDLVAIRKVPGLRTFVGAVVPKLAALAAMGAIDDWLEPPNPNRGERSLRGADLPEPEPTNGQWKPFPDDFVARLGKAALWIAEDLGPALIGALKAVMDVPLEGKTGRPQPARANIVGERRSQAIKDWSAQNPDHPRQFPVQFIVQISPWVDPIELDSWPPPNWKVLRKLVMQLQAAHFVIIALATAAREGELTGLSRDCLRLVGDRHLLEGHTFKLSDQIDGENRNWPLPKIAVTALQQQREIADVLAPCGSALWFAFKNYEAPHSNSFADMKSFSQGALKRLTTDVLVDGKPLKEWCEGSIHAHRFRKTVARLAALSMVGATSIMFDILGHRDPAMTLNYILSDPWLQDEIRRIAAEANVALSREALLRADENGGPAAPTVNDLKHRLAARSGTVELGAESLTEAAKILSMNGQVAMVRPGVLCMKTLSQQGPCTRKAGFPDVGNCSVGCQHRLELAAAMEDCRLSIERILAEMPSDEGDMMQVWWRAQLVTQLQRFPQLRARFLEDPRIQRVLGPWPQHQPA